MKIPLAKLLNIAKYSARDAGKMLSENTAARTISQSSAHDTKVLGDKLSEKIIVNELRKTGIQILTEEQGIIGEPNSENYCWIVDPLDGSVNYSRGIPFSCVSIALWKKEEPMLGVIYDFNRQEIFEAIVGQGAFLNSQPIQPSGNVNKENSILCTGFPVNSDFSNEGLNNFLSQVKEYKKIRLLGSAALSIAYVACGRMDVYLENNIMLWDVAAGIALATANNMKVITQGSEMIKYSYDVFVENYIYVHILRVPYYRVHICQFNICE